MGGSRHEGQGADRTARADAASWHVYVLRCGDGTLYTGVATDVERRLAEHRAGAPRGARYVRGRGPLDLVLSHPAASRAHALRLERALKALPKARKEALVAGRLPVEALARSVLGA